MGMIRYWLASDRYDVQCPTCLQCVPASKAVFDGLAPLPRHSRWSASWVQDRYRYWPHLLQRRWTLRLMLRLEGLVRTLNPIGEPVCEDVTPRRYRDELPDGCGQLGPTA